MKQIRNTAVMEVLSEDARAYGIKRLAPELDKEPSSLYGELNPYGDQGKAKMSFDDAIEAMRIMRRYDKEDVRDEMLDDCKLLREFHEAMRNGDHPNVVRKIYNAIHNEIDQSMKAYDMHCEQARQ